MASIELTARGSGYYRVYVEDKEFSKHTAEREAIERCTEVLAHNPSLYVYYRHDYIVDVDSSDDMVEAFVEPSSEDQPVSDGGMDLGDFLDRASGGVGDSPTIIASHDLAHFIEQATIKSRDQSKFRNTAIFFPIDGKQVLIGYAWQGYNITWYYRKRGVITIS